MTKAFKENPGKFLAVRAGLVSVLAVAIASQPALAQNEPAPASADEAPQREADIIVTATKRGSVQALQDVPTSIAAFGEETLEKMGVVEFTDFARSVVGLNSIDVGPGQKRYLVRGVNAPGEATVGLYLDNIPLTGGGQGAESAGDGQPDVDLYDMRQIEVLRGPQGTLYGSSSVSGIIRMVSNRPDLDSIHMEGQGDVASTKHGEMSYSVKGMVNVPLIKDTLALRVVGYHGITGGFVDSAVLKDSSGNFLKDINRHRRSGLRASLRWEAGPATEVLAQFLYQDIHSAARNAHNPIDSSERVGPPFIKREVSPGVFVSDNLFFVPAAGELRSNTQSLEPYNEKLYLGGLTVTHKFDDFAELTTAYSYQNRSTNSLIDSSPPHDLLRRFGNCVIAGGCPPSFVYGSPSYGAGLAIRNGKVFSPNGHVVSNGIAETEMHSLETRLASTWDKKINYVVGLFYQDRTQNIKSTLYHTLDNGRPNYGGPLLLDRRAKNNTKQQAAFGELYWEIADGLELMGGLRWFKTKRNQTSVVNVPFLTSFVTPMCDSDGDGAISHSQVKATTEFPTNPATGQPYKFNYGDNSCFPFVEKNSPGSENGLIKKFQVTYRPTEDISVFAAYAEGYRAGGTNAVLLPTIPPFFEHDRTREYSLGLKTQWIDNRLTFNVGAYQIDWYNQQTAVAISTQFNALTATKTPDGGPVSRSRGVEIEMSARPIDGLDIGANVTFLKTKLLVNLIDVVPASLLAASTESPPVRGNKGEALLGSPKHAGSAFAQYNWAVGNNLTAFVRTDIQFQSEIPKNNYNPARNSPNRAYVFGNLRFGVDSDNWSASIYIKNVTDKVADLFLANNLQSQNRITVNQPRTIGLSVNLKM